jgi:hypothetical protein
MMRAIACVGASGPEPKDDAIRYRASKGPVRGVRQEAAVLPEGAGAEGDAVDPRGRT